ncbi:MAG TPA: hypothetical protein VGJ48_05740 [Pyrinomonadaceae bacterium]|jgi:hypothetical protein
MNTQPFAKGIAEMLEAIRVDDVAPVEVGSGCYRRICQVPTEFESGSSIFRLVVNGRMLMNMMRLEKSSTLSAAN